MAARESRWIVRRQSEVAEFCGVSLDTVKSWAKQGMPGKPNAYDVATIIQWLRQQGPWRQHARADFDDPLLAGDGSPNLERYRGIKADLAELELASQRKQVMPRDKARTILGRWSAILRRAGERLGKRYGQEAATAFNSALDECEHVLRDELGEHQPANGHAG